MYIADVEVYCYVDDVGGTNNSCYDIPVAWYSEMVSSHIHTNGNRLPVINLKGAVPLPSRVWWWMKKG